VAYKAMDNFRVRIRQLTRRSDRRSMEQVVQRLRPYLLGWKAYFGLAQTPKVWCELDQWLRHRSRAIQLKHWKRPTTIYRELQAHGAGPTVAKRVAANSRRWWRNSDGLLEAVLTIAYFDGLGVPRRSWPQILEPPGADRHSGWCGRGDSCEGGPPYRCCSNGSAYCENL
jgi:RNA-directed DNA polymerase